MIYLFSLHELMRADLMVWIVGISILFVAIIAVFLQYRQHKRLDAELKNLSKVKRNTIEYDLVLKAMKLTVWRIDVPTRTITYESDYRDQAGTATLPPGTDVEMFCNTLTPESKARIAASMNDLVEGRKDECQEQYEVQTKKGEKRCWGELFATVDKRDLNGKPLTVVGASMNIDSQKELEQELIDARNQAEESERLKTAFLANISHEIRTPLNAIVGFSDVLPMAHSDEEHEELVGLIKKNTSHLLRLFEDLVNMSKLEAGGEAAKKARFDLDALLVELSNRFKAQSEEKGITLQIEKPAVAVRPLSDIDRIREILNHYVDNALKFTKEGSVTLGYSLLDNNKLRIWVRDTGIGIAPEHYSEHLFERFFKIDDFIPGTGLGLSICRNLAQSLGGTVGVESKLGEGSVFWVEIDKE